MKPVLRSCDARPDGLRSIVMSVTAALKVNEHETTTVILDIRLGESVSLRGRTVREGFFFRPVVKGARAHD